MSSTKIPSIFDTGRNLSNNTKIIAFLNERKSIINSILNVKKNNGSVVVANEKKNNGAMVVANEKKNNGAANKNNTPQ